MNFFQSLKTFCEYIGGSAETPPQQFAWLTRQWWWHGLWWGVLALVIIGFCGQTSKFIYIDF